MIFSVKIKNSIQDKEKIIKYLVSEQKYILVSNTEKNFKLLFPFEKENNKQLVHMHNWANDFIIKIKEVKYNKIDLVIYPKLFSIFTLTLALILSVGLFFTVWVLATQVYHFSGLIMIPLSIAYLIQFTIVMKSELKKILLSDIDKITNLN